MRLNAIPEPARHSRPKAAADRCETTNVGRFLNGKGLKPPAAAARVRMFYLPDSGHRTELMIIYVEALSPADISPRDLPRVSPADEKWPAIARRVTEDARHGLSIAVPGP